MKNEQLVGWTHIVGSGSRTERMVLRHSAILALIGFNVPENSTSHTWECFVSIRAGNKIETVKATKVVEWIFHDVARLALEVPAIDKNWIESSLFFKWQERVALHDKLLRDLISPKVYKEKSKVIDSKDGSYPKGLQDYYPGSWGHHLAMQGGDRSPDPLVGSVGEDRFWFKAGAQRLIHRWSGYQEAEAGELNLGNLSGSTEPYHSWSQVKKNEHVSERIETLYAVLRLGYLSALISSRLVDLFPDPWSTELLERGAEEGRRCVQWVKSYWAKETRGTDFPNPPGVVAEVVDKTTLGKLLA